MAATPPQSRRPLVWFSKCRTVSGGPEYSGSSGTYLRTGSSRDSLPSRARARTAAAVNCFETDPASKIVSAVIGASCSRSAMPNPLATTVLPPTETPTAQPGVVGPHFAKTASIFPESTRNVAACPCPSVTAAQKENSTTPAHPGPRERRVHSHFVIVSPPPAGRRSGAGDLSHHFAGQKKKGD